MAIDNNADSDNPLAGTDWSKLTTKYSVGSSLSSQSEEYRWRRVHNHPRMTAHLLKRWDERTPAGSVSPETAWLHAVGVGDPILSFFTDEGGTQADEVRLYHGETAERAYTVYFIVKGSPDPSDIEYHVRTVYQHSEITDPRVRAYLDVVREQAQSMFGQRGAEGGVSADVRGEYR